MQGFLWYFAMGCVRISVSGLRMERFINRAVRSGVTLRNMQRRSYTLLELETDLRGRRVLARLAQELGMTLRVLSVHGVPGWLRTARRRWSLAVSILAAAAVILVASQFVWFVRMESDLPGEVQFRVEQSLAELGVKAGCLRSQVDTQRVQACLRRDYPEIAFIGLRLRGMGLSVQIVAAVPEGDILDTDAPSQLVAGKTGVVEKVITTEGRALVQPGDVVVPGTVLISGQVPTQDADVTVDRYVHAQGQVLARVHYRGVANAAIGEPVFIRTADRTVHWVLEREGESILLAGRELTYDASHFAEESYAIPWITEWWGWRISRQVYTRMEQYAPLSLEALEQLLCRQAAHQALQSLEDGEILSRSHRAWIQNGRLYVEAAYTVREDIAQSIPMTGT